MTMSTELERGVGEVLIDADSLRTRVAELGEEVSDFYRGRDLLLVGAHLRNPRVSLARWSESRVSTCCMSTSTQ